MVVVGTRCAGAPLATLLARRGLKVCLVDKDRLPSDTPSTHAIQPAGVQVLERIGVLDALLELAPTLLRGRMVFGDSTATIDDIVALRRSAGSQRTPELTAATVRVLNHELCPSQLFTPAFSLTTKAQALRRGRGRRRAIMREAGTTAVTELRRHRAARTGRYFG